MYVIFLKKITSSGMEECSWLEFAGLFAKGEVAEAGRTATGTGEARKK